MLCKRTFSSREYCQNRTLISLNGQLNDSTLKLHLWFGIARMLHILHTYEIWARFYLKLPTFVSWAPNKRHIVKVHVLPHAITGTTLRFFCVESAVFLRANQWFKNNSIFKDFLNQVNRKKFNVEVNVARMINAIGWRSSYFYLFANKTACRPSASTSTKFFPNQDWTMTSAWVDSL